MKMSKITKEDLLRVWQDSIDFCLQKQDTGRTDQSEYFKGKVVAYHECMEDLKNLGKNRIDER